MAQCLPQELVSREGPLTLVLSPCGRERKRKGLPKQPPVFCLRTGPRPSPGNRLFHSFDLFEFQFHRRSAAEDGHGHLYAAAVEVEFLNDTVEAREGPVEDLHRIADLVIDMDLGLG